MRKTAIGISFKMYKNKQAEISAYLKEIIPYCENKSEIDVFVFPSMGTLETVSKLLEKSSIHYGAQIIAPIANGALTGEFSIDSLLDLNGDYVELAHAERRKIFKETEEMVRQKLILALEKRVTPVLCIGENTEEKINLRSHLQKQLVSAMKDIPLSSLKKVILAYEPIWAIGKAKAASSEHIHEAHQIIREELLSIFGVKVAEEIRIIYGGSVSRDNVAEIVNDDNVDGVFVGRFGHDPKNFKEIIDTVTKIKIAREKNVR